MAQTLDKQAIYTCMTRIRSFCADNGLANPVLVAATKSQPTKTILLAHEAGVTDVGENYVQEAQEKAAQGAYAGLRLHFIGRFQSNKAREVARLFDVVHSLDKASSADKLDKACAQESKTMDVFIQVYLGTAREGRSGTTPEELGELVQHIRKLRHLNLVGLMCMPATDDPCPQESFRSVRQLGETLGLRQFSMGMSGDWQDALLAGATHIRLGTVLFGSRTK